MNGGRRAPRVSVVMAVYNGERYLRQAMESILDQTFRDFEFIIVDDGSTDATPHILDEYADPRIVRLRNYTNSGVSYSLNRALDSSIGEYVAIQDADDLSYPTRLEQQVAFLNAHPEVGLVGSAYDVINEAGQRIGRVSAPTDNETIQHTLVRHNCFGHGTVMMQRLALLGAGKYAGGMPPLPPLEDYEMYLRLAECTCLANLAEPLYAWRRHTTSVTAISDRVSAERQRVTVLRRMLARRVQSRSGVPGWMPEDLAAARVVLAVSAGLLEEWDTARQALTEAWQLAPGWLEGGGFVEVVEERMGRSASVWAGWSGMPSLLQRLLGYVPDGVKPRALNGLFLRLYRHAAFEAHTHRRSRQVRRAAWEYWRRQPLSLFTDRGMASIWVQSWRPRAGG